MIDLENLKKDLGNRIRLQRKNMNMTQEKLAEKLDISVKHLSEVERGISGLSLENLAKISIILEKSIDYLVKGCTSEIDNDFSNLLQNIPKGKEHLIKELMRTGIKLSQKNEQ